MKIIFSAELLVNFRSALGSLKTRDSPGYTKNTEIKEIKQDLKEKNLIKFFNKENKKMFLVFKKTRIKEKETFKIEKKLIEKEKCINEEKIKELYFFKKEKENKTFFKIIKKVKDYITNENIYYINVYKKINIKEKIKVKIIEEFRIFNTIKNIEIYNKNDFKLLKIL